MPFVRLKLIEPLLRAVKSEGYTIPTAIQREAIPHVLEGRDILGCAQTGTGKTAAFALPILQLLHGRRHGSAAAHGHAAGHGAAHPHAAPARTHIRALILTPTRELAAQIGESFRAYGKYTGLRHTVVFGGVGQGPQVQAIRQGIDILVATPGRLLDLMNQRVLSIRDIEIFVLDEADRMLDMGFIHDIRRVIAQIPQKRQTMLFSATIPKEIRAMSAQLLTRPVEITVPGETAAADTVRQVVYFVEQRLKGDLLAQVLSNKEVTRALVFTRTKRGADRVVRRLVQSSVSAQAIHSDKSQGERMRALENFKRARTRVLVASDIAARGLDVDNISHVINYDMPGTAEMYVHRIGRTGRAGAWGHAITFCAPDQRGELREIERMMGRSVPVLQHSLKLADRTPEERAADHRYSHTSTGDSKGSTQRPESSYTRENNRFWRSRSKTSPPGSRWRGSR